MGSVYQQTIRDCATCGRKARPACRTEGHAITVRKLPTWWIKWYRDGRPHRESTGTAKKTEAERQLKLREGDSARGLPITPRVTRVRFEEAAEDAINDYRINRRRSLDDQERRILKHLTPYFGGRRMVAITTDVIRAYIVERQAATVLVRQARIVRRADGTTETIPEVRRPVSNGEINRELTALKRIFSLALQAGKLLHKPYIPMLQEHNVRTGFFERAQYEAVIAHLPAAVRPVVTFGYLTGWRIDSEVLPLQWRQIDFAAGEVRLDPQTTKNGEGRVFPMTTELRVLLEDQQKATRTLAQDRGVICPHVFHRDGAPIRSFRKVWKAACAAAGCPGRIPHDFRRTAVRNLVRAGIPERVAMTMTGHKTRSVFERYNIVSEGDLRDAARRLDVAAGSTPGEGITGRAGTGIRA